MAVAFTRSEQPGTEEATLFYGNERDADTLSIKEDGIRGVEGRNRALFAWETRSLVRRRVLQVVIGFVGIAIIVCIILAFKLSASATEYAYFGTARFKPDEKHIDFKNAAGQFVLSAEIGLRLSTNSPLKERHTKSKTKSKFITSDGVSFVMTQETETSLSLNWTSSSKQPVVFMDCFFLSTYSAKNNWYGGSALFSQQWPMEKVRVNMAQYIPRSTRGSQNISTQTFGSVLERYWLNSHGVAIVVDASVPLHVSVNANGDGKLCIKSDTNGYLQTTGSYLGYRILSGYNPRDLHLTVVERFLGKPNIIPNEVLITKPSWIIGNYSVDVSQKHIQDLKEKISLFNYTCGSVVIGGQYGEKNLKNELDESNEVKLVNELKSICCNVSMNIHPYQQVGLYEKFSEAAKEGHLLKDCGGKVPGLVKWSNSLAGCIDVTRNLSKAWFKEQLVGFQQKFGFDSFEFHGGEVNHLPSCYQFSNKAMDPGYFSTEYAKFAVSMKGLNVHIGHHTQKLPVFVKTSKKDPTWDDVTGLKTLIPTVLTYGIMGYPYVLPSGIGGDHISKELYIRWMQASVFLPGVQFDMKPWEFDQETITIVRNLLGLRSRLSSVIMDAFKNVTKTGVPVIRPMWWVAPTDPIALNIATQFMLGDRYLVAPVLAKGETVKRVYLPKGRWIKQFDDGTEVDNKKRGQWKNYDVKLTSLPYFKCMTLYN